MRMRRSTRSGSYVFPGVIDPHVHFNEPGRADWEGLSTGSAALAAGGGTCFFDMPLKFRAARARRGEPAREKRALAEEKVLRGFRPLGRPLCPATSRQAGSACATPGAIGLKAFMCESGIASFPRVDATVLREGMKRAAKARDAGRGARRGRRTGEQIYRRAKRRKAAPT